MAFKTDGRSAQNVRSEKSVHGTLDARSGVGRSADRSSVARSGVGQLVRRWILRKVGWSAARPEAGQLSILGSVNLSGLLFGRCLECGSFGEQFFGLRFKRVCFNGLGFAFLLVAGCVFGVFLELFQERGSFGQLLL